MKKILFLCAIAVSINCLSQNAYYDALTIAKYVKKDTLIVSDSNAVKAYCTIFNNYLKFFFKVFINLCGIIGFA